MDDDLEEHLRPLISKTDFCKQWNEFKDGSYTSQANELVMYGVVHVDDNNKACIVYPHGMKSRYYFIKGS